MTQRVVNYTYGTGNPVLPNGSTDVRDGIDNLQSMDVFMNAPDDEYNQRDGGVVKTVHGMINEFNQQINQQETEFETQILEQQSEFNQHISGMAFTRVGTFKSGATLDNLREVLLWNVSDGGDGHEYGWAGTFQKEVPPNSTPSSTGGIGPGAWVDRSDVTLRSELAAPGGAGLVGFLQYGEGAVQRTVKNRLLDSINVKDFGALGDGITDDSIAIQKALTRAGEQGRDLYFPSGKYVINSTCTLPAQSISVHGCWSNTVITGSAAELFAFPNVIGKVHNISRLSFEYAGTAIAATKIWSAAGIEPSCIVSECRFKSLAANSKAITLSGIWAARVYGNSFVGTGKAANETAISIVTGDNMNTSVMNTDIQNNSSVLIAYPVRYDGRTLSAGGRVEGVTILGNKFVAGKTGVMLSQTLATAINGNMCSDFEYGVDLYGDFDFVISGNPDLSGSIASIRLNDLDGSILERGAITGNKMVLANAGGGILINAPSGKSLRAISITGNVIGRSATGAKAAYGVKFVGNNLSHITITGNVFMYTTTAVDRGADINNNTINSNIYYLVDNTGVSSPHNTPFTASVVETLAGDTSHTITVALPAGAARDKPFFASCILSSIVGGSPIICSYRYDISTKDKVVFTAVRANGTALPSGSVRFAVAALPF